MENSTPKSYNKGHGDRENGCMSSVQQFFLILCQTLISADGNNVTKEVCR